MQCSICAPGTRCIVVRRKTKLNTYRPQRIEGAGGGRIIGMSAMLWKGGVLVSRQAWS